MFLGSFSKKKKRFKKEKKNVDVCDCGFGIDRLSGENDYQDDSQVDYQSILLYFFVCIVFLPRHVSDSEYVFYICFCPRFCEVSQCVWAVFRKKSKK